MAYLNDQSVKSLRTAIDDYEGASATYDEVFNEVRRRIAATGFIGKADIGALVLWKRIRADTRWANRLMHRPEAVVRAVSAEAFAPGLSDDQRIALLDRLNGFGGTRALASTVLTAWDPNDFGVIDRWSRRAITLLQIWGNELYPQPLNGAYMNYSPTYLTMVRHMGIICRGVPSAASRTAST